MNIRVGSIVLYFIHPLIINEKNRVFSEFQILFRISLHICIRKQNVEPKNDDYEKVLLLLVCLFTLQTVVWADDDKPIQVNQLPQTAQTFIKTHFPNNKVAMAKMETDWFDKSYDVIFTNGDKLEFDKKGVWTEVNCKYSAVPVAVVPDAIKKYVTTNYPDAKMLKIERDKYDYEVKLSNGWEIKFDMQFNVIDIDN